MRKQELLGSIDARREATDLLGPPKNGKYRCYNRKVHANGDATPSLTMDGNGHWRCHSCGEGGDIIQLYMEVNNMASSEFNDAIIALGRKHGISGETTVKFDAPGTKTAKLKERKRMGKVDARKAVRFACNDMSNKKYNKGVKEWLGGYYGITNELIVKYMIGWSSSSKRLFIPIPLNELREDGDLMNTLINIRKHDIMRYHCTWMKGDEVIKQRPAEVFRDTKDGWTYNGWKPSWKGTGKVMGVRGHNTAYIYPMEKMHTDGVIYVVAGELKALLMIRFGFNAVCFTSGESNYPRDLLFMFAGKNVRVIYDADDAGDRGATKIANAIMNAGAATVETGLFPDTEGMPANGDITDYLRIKEWDPEALNDIRWRQVDRKKAAVVKPSVLGAAKIKSYTPIKFGDLTKGSLLGKFVKVPVLVSGREATSYAVPVAFNARCLLGKASQIAMCKNCAIAGMGFESMNFPALLPIKEEHVVDLTGMPKAKMQAALKGRLGVPAKCHKPKIKIKYGAVEKMVVVPTIDIDKEENPEYKHHQVYVLADDNSPDENVPHMIEGQIIGDPKNNSFTLAVTSHSPVDGDVFSYEFSNVKHSELKEAIWGDKTSVGEAVTGVVADLRENVLHKYGVDEMIIVELLSFFMPFGFSIGQHYCHKVCPEVMILGDTRVGKSTTAKDLAKHLGAGRYVDCGSNATFVGLVGGNADLGGKSAFTWGVIPTSHRGHLSLDEYNKLDLRTIGGLTNIKSSGVAERTTNSGARKTAATVRFLTMCNPRTMNNNSKRIQAYSSPLDAAIEVVGSPQDLARVDLLYVAYGVKDIKVLNTMRESDVLHKYTQDVARYHLQWAWSLTAKKIVFSNPRYVLDRSVDMVTELGRMQLIAPAEAKFKLGRLAVAFATMVYSYDQVSSGVLVKNDHVDIAYAFIVKLYSEYMENAGIKSGVLPKEIIEMFDNVTNPKMLRMLSTATVWLDGDFKELFGPTGMERFKYEAQLNHNLMTRGHRGNFNPADGVRDLIDEYVRDRLESN